MFKALNKLLRDRNRMVKVAIFGLPITLCGAAYCKMSTESNFNAQEFNNKTLKLINGYKDGIALVGKPYRTTKPNLGESDINYTTGLNASIYFDIIGSRRTCTVQAWSSRHKIGDSWNVDKMDMECDGTQWTFYISPDKQGEIKPTMSSLEVRAQLNKLNKQKAENMAQSMENTV